MKMMKNERTKKNISLIVAALAVAASLAGCGGGFSADGNITVISRESGSGTRGAFVELFGIEEKDESGKKIDKTVATADINDSTGVILTNVASNENAIGYISLGALNDTVKALDIDGAEATVANIKNGSYAISRPFNVATKGTLSPAAQDFMNYILSTEGQAVVESKDYIPLDGAVAYSGKNVSGKVVVAGSSSVTPLMEKLREAYIKINPDVDIEIQQSDSSSGMKSVASGICDIGMASRELKESELAEGLAATVIATDGIAVIVNPKNTLNGLKKEQVKEIYTGASVKWSDVGAK